MQEPQRSMPFGGQKSGWGFFTSIKPLTELLAAAKAIRRWLRDCDWRQSYPARFDTVPVLLRKPFVDEVTQQLGRTLTAAAEDFPGCVHNFERLRNAFNSLEQSFDRGEPTVFKEFAHGCESDVEYSGYWVPRLIDASDEIEMGIWELQHLVSRMAVPHFGNWGAWFFALAADSLDEWDFPDPSFLRLTDTLSASSVFLDDSKFSVTIRGEQPVYLGNNNRWRLLKVLLENSGRYLPETEILEAVGKDSMDGKLKFDKRHLVQDLMRGGYGRLANCIRSTRGHYGLLFEEAATEKQP